MSRDPELLAARNKRIKQDYDKLEAEKVHGVQKYRYEAILAILSNRWFLSPDYIGKIILAENKTENQLEIFNNENPD